SSAMAGGRNLSPDQSDRLERDVLERLIQIQLLLAKATDVELTKAKEVADKRFENIRTRAGSEETLNRQLKSVGLTQEDLRKNMNEEAVAELVLDRELKITIPEEDIKKYYDEHPSKFEEPDMVRASHILMRTRDRASESELTPEQKDAKRK